MLLTTTDDPKLRNPAEAVTLARKGVDLDPKRWPCWHTLSVAYYNTGDWKGALEARQKTMELAGDACPRDWLWLAMIHHQLEQPDQAHQWYDRAVKKIKEMPLPAAKLVRLHQKAENLLENNPNSTEPKTKN